jgi:hypothetical protein
MKSLYGAAAAVARVVAAQATTGSVVDENEFSNTRDRSSLGATSYFDDLEIGAIPAPGAIDGALEMPRVADSGVDRSMNSPHRLPSGAAFSGVPAAPGSWSRPDFPDSSAFRACSA